jgi:hypothetical protein
VVGGGGGVVIRWRTQSALAVQLLPEMIFLLLALIRNGPNKWTYIQGQCTQSDTYAVERLGRPFDTKVFPLKNCTECQGK